MAGSTLNELVIGGESLLLVEGRNAVHLAVADDSEEALPAVAAEMLDRENRTLQPTAARYRRSELVECRWSRRTICGRSWSLMAATDLGPVVLWQEPAFSPTCRSCMRSLDSRFPEAQPDESLKVVVELVVQAVHLHGCAAVEDVPGPQIEPLRRAVRARLRAAGFRAQTVVAHATVHVLSDDAYEAIDPAVREQRDRAAANVVGALLSGETPAPVDSSEWRFRWSTWAG